MLVTSLIHSVDSLRLLAEIDAQALEMDLHSRVLIEVNGEQVQAEAVNEYRIYRESVQPFGKMYRGQVQE